MASGLKWTTHNDFSKGMSQDQPSYLLPDGFVYDARSVFITKTGQLRKRYGNTRHTTDSSGVIPTAIATVRNYFATITDRGYLGYQISGAQPTARFTSFACQDAQSALTPATWFDSYYKGTPGVPASWSGHAIFPLRNPNTTATGTPSAFVSLGGSQLGLPNNSSPHAGGACTVTALNDQITITNANANARAGDYIFCAITGTNEYMGRIKEVITTSSFRVEPTPTITFSATSSVLKSAVGIDGSRAELGTLEFPVAAGALTVHQNRIIIGNVSTTTFSAAGKSNRIYWSTLLTQPSDSPVGGVDGLVPFLKAGWLRRNYETFPNMNAIVSIVALGPSTLLILGDTGVSLVSGSLGTVTADTATSSYTVRILSSAIGCVSAASVQLTPAGVIFASADGVYVTDGNTFTNLCENKIKQLWRTSLTVGTQINGSALIEDRIYALSTTTSSLSDEFGGTLFCDLSNNFAWTRTNTPNAQSLPFRMSALDPGPETNRVYVIGTYTDTTIAKDPQLLRLDPIYPREYSNFTLDVSFLDGTDVLGGGAAIVDANNSLVRAKIITKAYTEGDPNTLRRFRHSIFLTSAQDADVATAKIYADYVMGTSPDKTWINGNTYTLGQINRPASLLNNNQSFSTRFDTNMNAQAISYVIADYQKDSVATASMPSWTLYEVTTATNQLRPGRNGLSLTPDRSSTVVSYV
jgi:hypothetical protein